MILMALIWIGVIHTQAQRPAMVVTETNGKQTIYCLDERPRTSFSGKNLIITTRKTDVIYPLSRVRTFTLTEVEGDPLSIRPGAAMERPTVVFENPYVILRHFAASLPVRVYDVAGTLLHTLHTDANGAATLDLSGQQTGVYLIETDGITYKIRKP